MAACCCSIRPIATPRLTIPLLEVRRGEWEVRDVQNIADMLVDPEGALERRNHWEKTSHSLLVGAILHVLYAEPDKTLAGVADFLSDPKRPIETTLRAMMTTPHLGEAGPHPVIASAARELLNKSENERSGVLSTAMSLPRTLSRSGRGPGHPALRLAHPRSRRGRAADNALPRGSAFRHQPDQAAGSAHPQPDRPPTDRGPACQGTPASAAPDARRIPGTWAGSTSSRSALAFMAGYGLKSFLIAQSLNQIEKAYGPNNAILDNCHVRVSFATNDERTAKRVSDALGTATEMRAMKNYAGHRLSPWLGHLMVSRQETARPLLTPGEVMQLPPDDELVLVSGCPPIRARKVRYFRGPEAHASASCRHRPGPSNAGRRPSDDWSQLASSRRYRCRKSARRASALSRAIPRMAASAASRNFRSTKRSCRNQPSRRRNSPLRRRVRR